MVGVLRSFEFPLTQYADDVQRIVGTAIRRFGPEEWKLVLLTNEIHGHLGIYSTLGHGLIRVAEVDTPCPEATFTCEGKTLTLSLKEQYRTQIEADIRTGVERYGHSREYWAYVRSLALRYWSSWDRNGIFAVRSEK